MPEVGQITRWDTQADIWQQQYRYTQDLGSGQWEIEILPPDDEVIEAMLAHWSDVEAGITDSYRSPVWSDGDDGEEPRIIGKVTAAEMLDRDLQRAEEQAGRKMVIHVVNSNRYASYF